MKLRIASFETHTIRTSCHNLGLMAVDAEVASDSLFCWTLYEAGRWANWAY